MEKSALTPHLHTHRPDTRRRTTRPSTTPPESRVPVLYADEHAGTSSRRETRLSSTSCSTATPRAMAARTCFVRHVRPRWRPLVGHHSRPSWGGGRQTSMASPRRASLTPFVGGGRQTSMASRRRASLTPFVGGGRQTSMASRRRASLTPLVGGGDVRPRWRPVVGHHSRPSSAHWPLRSSPPPPPFIRSHSSRLPLQTSQLPSGTPPPLEPILISACAHQPHARASPCLLPLPYRTGAGRPGEVCRRWTGEV